MSRLSPSFVRPLAHSLTHSPAASSAHSLPCFLVRSLARLGLRFLLRSVVSEVMLPFQLLIFQQHGFPGEEGLLLAQRALMEHSGDPVVVRAIGESSARLARRAGLV